MSDKERFDAVNGISRRKALQSTVGFTGTVVGLSGVAAADEDPDGQAPRDRSRMDSEYILDEDYWRNENGRVEFDHADFDQWNVSVTDRQSGRKRGRSQTADARSRSSRGTRPGVTDEVDIFIGENSNTSVKTEQIVTNVGPGASPAKSRPDTEAMPVDTKVHTRYDRREEVKLVGTSIPDWVPGIGGAQFGLWGNVRINTDDSYGYVVLTLEVGVTSVWLFSVGFDYSIRESTCTTVEPEDFPLELEACLFVELQGDDLTFGGNYDICAPPDDPCGWFADCQFCGSGDLSASIELF